MLVLAPFTLFGNVLEVFSEFRCQHDSYLYITKNVVIFFGAFTDLAYLGTLCSSHHLRTPKK